MGFGPCHEDRASIVASSRDRAKKILLDELGVGRVAAWCNCSADAVYQWLSRGTDMRPIPPERAIAIINAAAAEGVLIDGRVLWPAMPVLAAPISSEAAQ